jgi:TROVE domain-containing protein
MDGPPKRRAVFSCSTTRGEHVVSKFNTSTTKPAKGKGPLATEATASTTTYEGGPGFTRDAKSELFLLAVANMVGEDSFYEKAGARDERYENLVRTVAVADPAWMLGFVGWLRNEANMRSASLVAAAEAVKARLDKQAEVNANLGSTTVWATDTEANRKLINAALQRADEPGELLAYWMGRYGRKLPKPVKRGVADAVQRLYSEYSLLKYDTASHSVRFGDVLDLCHPSPATPEQGALFRYALDRRHDRAWSPDPDALPMVAARMQLRERLTEGYFGDLLLPERARAAGLTWEEALSLAGDRVDKRTLWEALIPTMGYMALLRNLRNFDEAGVSDEMAREVEIRLTDEQNVRNSRQFPFRFLSAYENVASDRWRHPLGKALDACLANVPQLPGRTLVLIDTSASMTSQTISAKSKVTPAKAAAVFGIVLALRCGADVYGFADGVFRHELAKGASALRQIERFLARTGEVGHGTDIPAAISSTYANHDRVIILSDMQTVGRLGYWNRRANSLAGTDPGNLVPADKLVYGFNLLGYQAAAFSTAKPNRYELGGMSDKVWQALPLLESGRDAAWPWL